MSSRVMAELGFPEASLHISTVPSYWYTLKIEETFDKDVLQDWIRENNYLSVYLALVYLALVFFGQAYMRNKAAFRLTTSLILWNCLLAIFSIGGTVRFIPEMYYTLKHFGFEASYCTRAFHDDNSVTALWGYLFLVSKVVELFDTAFVVLRKQKLIFLHWFHHSTVLVMSWFLALDLVAFGRWMITMNFTVHSLMYSYYAFRAMKVRVPRAIAMGITTVQVLQMIAGFYISVRGFEAWFTGQNCAISARTATMAIVVYSFYFVLFAKFFYRSYVEPALWKILKSN